MNRNDLTACLLSGILLAVSFPPLSLTPVIFFALAPLLSRLKPEDPKGNAQKGFWTGLVFYSLSLYWFIHVTFGGLILLILVLSSVFAGLAAVSGWNRFPALRIPLTAAAWALVEYVRSLGAFSFAWDFLGHALYRYPGQLQITYWFGVYALTFLLVLTNHALAELYGMAVQAWKSRNVSPLLSFRAPYPIVFLILSVAAWAGNGLYGASVLRHLQALEDTGKPFRVALIQGNFQQGVKEEASPREMLAKYMTLTEATLSFQPDLVIWPESTVPAPINYWPSLLKSIHEFVEQHQLQMLVGTVYGERHGEDSWEFWNRAFLFSPGQEFDYSSDRIDMSRVPSYDKIHLVPYGEFVPMGQIWPMNLIETLIEEAGAGIFERGKEITVFETRNGVRFCVAICYESSRSDQLCEGMKRGADFIVTITNDAWFRNSPGLMQHFLLSIFRAAENRCYVVRAANTGITGVIKPGGVVAETLSPNKTDFSTYELKIARD